MKKRGSQSNEAELALEHFKKQGTFHLQALHDSSEHQISISHQAVHTYALKCRRCKRANLMRVSWVGSYMNDKKLLKVSRPKLEWCTLYNKGNDNQDDLEPL